MNETCKVKPITHFILSEHTNNLYKKEASSSLALARDVASKLNEVITSFNELAKEKYEKIHEQDGKIRKAILYMKDNLLNAIDTLLNSKGEQMIDNSVATYLGTLQAQLNNLIGKVQSGSITSMDAEVIDARVDEDGTENINLGYHIRRQTKRALKSANVHITTNNYSQHFTDANLIPNGKTYFINYDITSSMIANLPKYGSSMIFTSFNYDSNNNHGKIQICGNKKSMYWRYEEGSNTYNYTEWKKFIDNTSEKSSKLAIGKSTGVKINIENGYLNIEGSGFIWSMNNFIMVSDLISKSLSLECQFSYTYLVYIRDNQLYKEQIDAYTSKDNDIIIAELYLTTPGSLSTNVWTIGNVEEKINSIESTSSQLNKRTCSIFQKVVCCGDSYTSGHIQTANGTYTINEKYAYPHFMEKLTGSTYVNCGKSGANVLTWLTDERGLTKAKLSGKAQAYIVGLGLNDVQSSTDRYVALGSKTDIGTSNSTYYAGLSRIVRELKAISPNAIIFIQTIPKTGGLYDSYNQAIRDIVDTYKSTYNTHLLDLYEYRDLYNVSSLSGDSINGHYTALGYQQFAEILCEVMSNYINSNISKFQNVHLIEYDE